ncbi:MAG: hypothetical protein E7566_03990 [Ruminococcaceae bacterium]|nr:hypothetical protein [Oscillospiraceae bacterium]
MSDLMKSFDVIVGKVAEPLTSQNFKREKTANTDKEIIALFTGEAVAYSVIYFIDKKHMVLRSCAMTEDGPDNEWNTMATWMFDPETDGLKEAESIGNDFYDAVSATAVVKRVKQAKKKKSDEGNADPLFLAKRFVTFFPELKDVIKEERESYEEFRGVYFIRTYVLEKFNALISRGAKGEMNKMAQMISTQYANGDMDTRSIITIVILNSIEEKNVEKFMPLLSEELQKAWSYALKIKGKKIKPEKPQKSIANYSGSRLG